MMKNIQKYKEQLNARKESALKDIETFKSARAFQRMYVAIGEHNALSWQIQVAELLLLNTENEEDR